VGDASDVLVGATVFVGAAVGTGALVGGMPVAVGIGIGVFVQVGLGVMVGVGPRVGVPLGVLVGGIVGVNAAGEKSANVSWLTVSGRTCTHTSSAVVDVKPSGFRSATR